MGTRHTSTTAAKRSPRAMLARQLHVAFDTLEPRRLLAAFTVDPAQDVSASNFHTISDAVAAAASTPETDDTIGVAAGNFTEDVAVNTPVTITGAKTGINPSTDRGLEESVLIGQFAIRSPGVMIDGFTVSGGSSAASSPDVAGIFVAASGSTLSNNILLGAAGVGTGILVPSSTPSGTTSLSDNNISGWAIGISVQAADATTIAGSEITQNAVAGIALDLLADPGASTISISENALSNAGVPQIRLDGGTDAVDSVALSNNAVTLVAGSTFISTTASTPISGVSSNTFTVIRSGTEDTALGIDLSLIDGTDIASLTTSGLAGAASATGAAVTYTPTGNFNGLTGFGFTTIGGATGVVSLTIAAVNDAPTGSSIPSQSLLEGQTKTIALATFFSDVDGDTLTYSLTSAPSFVSVDPTTGIVTIAPHTGDAASYNFLASASDGTASASSAISLTVVRAANQAPVFSNLPSTVSVAENTTGALFNVNATDPDGDQITYAIVAGNAAGHFAIDSATGAITLLSALDAETLATYSLMIRATDNGDPAPASADATLGVTVTDQNDNATSVTLAGPTTAAAGDLLHYVATANDADVGAVLSYQWFVDNVLQTGATGASFNVTFGPHSTHAVKVSVSDRGATPATDTQTVSIPDNAPTGSTVPPQSLREGQTKTIALANFFSDVDGDALTYSLIGAPSFVTVDSTTGIVSIAPQTGNAGNYSFAAAASDGSASASSSISLAVVRAANNAPVISNLPASVSVAENTTGAVYSVHATDLDGDHLVYAIIAGNGAGHFAIDSSTGVVTLVSALDAETAASYSLTILVTDDGEPAPASTSATLGIAVTDQNDNPTSVTLTGPSTAVEGQALHYTATANDADVGAVLSYQWSIDDVIQTGATGNTFDITFASDSTHLIKVAVSDRGANAAVATQSVEVDDTPPTIPVSLSVDHVNEGTAFSLTVGGITDPDPSDVAAIGQLSIEWGDQTYTIINSDTDPTSLANIRAGHSFTTTHTYSDGTNTSKPITVRVYDSNGNAYTVAQSILVNNVAPTGTFSIITPTVSIGNSGSVNWFGQSDVSPDDLTAGLRYTYAIDRNNNGTLDAGDTLITGDGTYAGSVFSSSATIPNTLLTQTGTYKILGLLLDKDSSPVLTRSVTLTVTPGVLQVVSLGGDHAGITIIFNQKVDQSAIDIYDGNDATNDVPDVTVQKANGTSIKGSLIFNAAGNGFDFIATGGILVAGTYTVTLRSGTTGFHLIGGGDLDGDFNGAAGGTYSSTFGVNAPSGPILTIPDFARGPGQSVDIIPGTPSSDLPISINTPIPVTSLNFQIRYNAALLTIRPADPANGIADVYAGSGLPAGWAVDYSLGVNVINISLTQTSPGAASILGSLEIVKIIATVPNDPTIYGKSEILSFASVITNGNSTVEPTSDRAVHKVMFLGDANLDGTVNAADAALIESIVLGTATGFDQYRLTDPALLVDSSRNGIVDSQDATNAAWSGFTGGRPTSIPDFTPLAIPLGQGADPTYSIPSSFAAKPGTTISVPINVTDDARGIQAGTIRIYYDSSKFTLASTPVLAGSLLNSGWTILNNMNAPVGYIEIAFYSGAALAKSVPLVGSLLTLQFNVASNAADGVSPLTIAAPTGIATSPTSFYDKSGTLFSTTAVSGSILIDTQAPTVTVPTFNYSGNSQSLTVIFSKNVGSSIAASDFELFNLKTSTYITLVVSSISSDGKTVTLTFSNTGGITANILKDGDYRFRVLAGQVADSSGNVLATTAESNFFFMNGDANHDRTVDFNDLVILAQNYGKSSGVTFATGDLNYDGKVDFNDLVLLAQLYNTTLAMPASLIAPTRPTQVKPKTNVMSTLTPSR